MSDSAGIAAQYFVLESEFSTFLSEINRGPLMATVADDDWMTAVTIAPINMHLISPGYVVGENLASKEMNS